MICPNCKKDNLNEKATECAYCHTQFYDNAEQAATAVKSIATSQVLEKVGKAFLAIVIAFAVLLAAIFVVPNLPKKETPVSGNNVNTNSNNNQNNNSNKGDASNSGSAQSNNAGNSANGGTVDAGSMNNNSSSSSGNSSSNGSGNNSSSSQVKTYQTNETWEVPGVWKIKFKGAAMHYFCNMHDDGAGADSCVTLVFDIENTGSETIYFTYNVYDEDGEKASSYACIHDDGIISLDAGSKQTNVKHSYAIKNSSSYVMVSISKSGYVNGEYKTYQAKFKVDVYTDAGSGSGNNTGNATQLPKDVVYYEEHPEVPDFGAMLGVEPETIERSSGVVGYSYDAASKDPKGTAVKDYVALLEKCGYTYAGGRYTDDGNSVVYYDNNTYGWRVGITTTTYSLLILVSKK